MRSQHPPEILTLIGGGVCNPFKAHVAAHFVERLPLVLQEPCFQVCTNGAQVLRAMTEEGRHHLCDVGSRHRCFDDIKSRVHTTCDGQRSFDTPGQGCCSPQSH